MCMQHQESSSGLPSQWDIGAYAKSGRDTVHPKVLLKTFLYIATKQPRLPD